tara:strand:- start:17604 stop:17720 length:117 start_codon:yes stop_codon:yes gene_type:complete
MGLNIIFAQKYMIFFILKFVRLRIKQKSGIKVLVHEVK